MIGFLHPWMLSALPAVALPLLLHLLARREPPTVAFPAVRYLRTATAEHQRRFRLQHWLLLLLRMLLILALVLAASGPTMQLAGVPGHAPGALVVILDNSASSGAVVGGTPQLEALVHAARQALGRGTPDDALWLVPADGRPRRGSAASLESLLDSLTVLPTRLDLGEAVTLANEILSDDSRPGEILLLSDLQASALTAAPMRAPLIVGRPTDSPPVNRGVVSVEAGPQPWTREGGRLTVAVAGDSSAPLTVTARLGNGPPRETLVRSGDSVSVPLASPTDGWFVASAELAADEFRLDNRGETVVHVSPVASVRCDRGDRYLAAACDVLETNHRIVAGNGIALGSVGAGPSIVMPPADAAELGALNRQLQQRGSEWHFGSLHLDAVTTDSGGLLGVHRIARRYTLETAGSGRTGVLVSAGGKPWAVRSGDIVLLGSRLDPAWTDLPLSAEFMPFMDRLLNRAVRGETALITASAGAPAALPDQATEVRRGDRRWSVEGGDFFTPTALGAYFLLAGSDTIGALVAAVDPRESQLRRASDDEVRRVWPGARLVPLDDAGDAAFSSAARADLRGPLLWLALAVGLGEVLIASTRRRKT
jgi:hypothetical protein